MWTYVLFNIKSNLKRKENLILVVLFIICEIALLFILNTKSFTESPYQTSLGISIASVSQKNDPKLYQEFMDEVNLIRQTIDKGEQDGKEKENRSSISCCDDLACSALFCRFYRRRSGSRLRR